MAAVALRGVFEMRSVQLSSLTDEALLEELCRGDDDALAILFDRHYRLIFRTAHRVLRDSGEAEDLMQEVFLEVYRAAAKFDVSRGSVKTWMLQYAYHRSLNRLKYLKIRGHYGGHSRAEWGHADEPSFPEYQSSIKRGLEQLTENERDVIEEVCFEGLLLKEIAERRGQSLTNTRNYYYRGIRKLRTILGMETADARS
jgi:RNA polymerase sigma-70 factor (ECF subfamily)